MKKIVLRPIFFMLIIALLGFSACSKANQSTGQEKAADFTLRDLDGKRIALADILKDKKAVLVFWTTWCPYCIRELPEIEKFYLKNKDKVTPIGIDIGEDKAQVEKALQRIGISYPMVLDSDGRVSKAYNVVGVPTIVAMDRDGTILYYGYSTKEMIDRVVF